LIRFTGPNENPRRKSAKTRTLKGGSALPRQALSGIPLMLQRLIRQASRGDPISLILFRIQGDIRRGKRSSSATLCGLVPRRAANGTPAWQPSDKKNKPSLNGSAGWNSRVAPDKRRPGRKSILLIVSVLEPERETRTDDRANRPW